MRILLALILCSVAFGGCLGGDDDGTSTTSTSSTTGSTSTTGTPTSTTTTTTTPAENDAPSATLAASIEQGSIPFNVTFTLDGADSDGDALTWAFDADGDNSPEAEGDSLPAQYVHTYDAEGLWNATLAVSDGTHLTVRNVVINATAAAAGEGEVVILAGSAIVPDPSTELTSECAVIIDYFLLGHGTEPLLGQWHDVEARWHGWTFATDPESMFLRWYDGTDYVGDSASAGEVPGGATVVFVCSPLPGAAADYTLTLTEPV